MWSMYSLEVSSAVMVLVQGVTIVALLRRSTTTNSESYPWETGRSVMKSMVIIPHTSVGIWFGCSCYDRRSGLPLTVVVTYLGRNGPRTYLPRVVSEVVL